MVSFDKRGLIQWTRILINLIVKPYVFVPFGEEKRGSSIYEDRGVDMTSSSPVLPYCLITLGI